MLSSGNRKWLLLAVGTIIWSLTMVKSGWGYNYGLGFWGPNGHDGIWHLSLIESLAQGKWDMPIFAGSSIQNYHLGFDLILAVIHRLTGVASPLLYFQLTPPLFAFLIGWLTYKFVQAWSKSDLAAWWSVFWVYFGGSLGWVLGKGESTFWSAQAISTLINPPFSLSLVLMLGALISLQKKKWVISGILLGLLFPVKVYAGFLAVVGLIAAFIWNRNRNLIWTLAIVVVMGGGYLSLATRNATGLVVWQPGWYLETMMSLSDRVGWQRYYSAMTNYRLGGQWLKAIAAYTVALGIFLIGNLGTRLLALGKVRKIDWQAAFMGTVVLAGIVVPMLFLQTGTPWNTIQFFYYSLFFAGILTGPVVAKIKNQLAVVVLVVLTLPTTWQSLQNYLPNRPPAMLPQAELQALKFLADQPAGVVLTYPFDSAAAKQAEANPPRPLYLYESTAYVAAFSFHPVFLEDEVNLNITGYDWPQRRQAVSQFFVEKNAEVARQFLQQNHIAYIYLSDVSKYRPQLGEEQLDAQTIYGDGRVAVWQVHQMVQ